MTQGRRPQAPATGASLAPYRSAPAGSHDMFLVVAVGASAGGLEAFTRFLEAVPAGCQMAFILVQHMGPSPDSLMAELLAQHTAMPVQRAEDGMLVQPGQCYVIPPASYLEVDHGHLHLSRPPAAHGARLPFDFLLRSLAASYGERAACVVLSGTGADGSIGLKAVAARGGLVVAQAPDDAGYDGMPRNAVATGLVDLVLPVTEIPAALRHFEQRAVFAAQSRGPVTGEQLVAASYDWLPDIIELLRTRTVHDFSLYKLGTMQRRVERRMALAGLKTDAMELYFAMLQTDPAEMDELANNLLINVTSFFRNPKVFEFLSASVIPDLLRDHPVGQPLRIWIAGCSTGEETYSLSMLLIEAIEKLAKSGAGRGIKLQVFASDVDQDAIARAREGQYPASIEDEISQARLERFFCKNEQGYRVLPELRSIVVFTVQDVLADPPFSRLDMISCRNLMIYLQPEAQAKVISLFDFALREGGILLLGNSETVGGSEGKFEVVGKAERVYRHIGRSRPSHFAFLPAAGEGPRLRASLAPEQPPVRQAALAEMGRRMVLDVFAPASIMINHKFECLYLLGPTDRYLRLAPGHPTHDLLSMARPGMRTALRGAIQGAIEQRARVIVPGGRTTVDGRVVPFDIDVQPVAGGTVGVGDALLLVCFVDRLPLHDGADPGALTPPRMLELERELESTRAELQGAIRDLEISTEDQKAINEEALSVNEEYQSTNEELLTSKEELQSLNEELTALNSQLQDTLERQRTTADDLQNVLYSTDVATLFLDAQLNIRFFTPATRSLFNLIPGDIGRPLADLYSQAMDPDLARDALAVLHQSAPIEREIQTRDGNWFTRRMLPYRSHASGIEGVVITFTDITERKRVKEALHAETLKTELASVAKSRFIATASHDLRQPLQTLTLLQGLLSKVEKGSDRELMLLGRFEDALGAMTGMLNTLLDINQIEAGVVKADVIAFPLDALFGQLASAFTLQAEARGLQLRVVNCGLTVESDPKLLEQMLRNLMANAVKYTHHGKILLGCRRHGGGLSIQVLDTGVGIPAGEQKAIFDEYYQVGSSAQARGPGLGLGLSIVQRLGELMGHRIQVRSMPSNGSVFSIDVPLAVTPGMIGLPLMEVWEARRPHEAAEHRTGAILVVEDDADLSDLLKTFLESEGHRVTLAGSGTAALEMMTRRAIRPDLVLTDFNLPRGLDGLGVARRLREMFGDALPVIVLTGDICPTTLLNTSVQDCVQLSKPVKLHQLTQHIQHLLPPSCGVGPRGKGSDDDNDDASVIFVVDDDEAVRDAVTALLTHDGRKSRAYASCRAFLENYRVAPGQCLLIDGYLPDIDGLELLRRLRTAGHMIPAVMMTGNSDVRMAVEAMQVGASDFIEKPIGGAELLASLQRALDGALDGSKISAWQEQASLRLASLTLRQREIMTMVLEGHPSKNIAADLHISQRTVENHRAAIMRKTGSSSLPELARLALAAAGTKLVPDPEAITKRPPTAL